MRLLPIKTPIITSQDNLFSIILTSTHKKLQAQDLVVISSKIMAVTENQVINLNTLTPSPLAHQYARQTHLSPEFCALVIREADQILNAVPGALLTIKNNIVIANAGIDQSNTQPGTAILWPKNPEKSLRLLWSQLKKELKLKTLGLILNDSRCIPLRSGTVGFALAAVGFTGVVNEIGQVDLFGRKIRITKRAVADMLASSANYLMGDTDQAIPLVIIRESGVKFTAIKQNMLMEKDLCLFSKLYT